jgi:putative ABC transport system substrate-binding protein
MMGVRRREFITLLGGTAAAWPLAARAQQAQMPVVGFLRSTSLADASHLVDAFRQGLKETRFVEGREIGRLLGAHETVSRTPGKAGELARTAILNSIAMLAQGKNLIRSAVSLAAAPPCSGLL